MYFMQTVLWQRTNSLGTPRILLASYMIVPLLVVVRTQRAKSIPEDSYLNLLDIPPTGLRDPL